MSSNLKGNFTIFRINKRYGEYHIYKIQISKLIFPGPDHL